MEQLIRSLDVDHEEDDPDCDPVFAHDCSFCRFVNVTSSVTMDTKLKHAYRHTRTHHTISHSAHIHVYTYSSTHTHTSYTLPFFFVFFLRIEKKKSEEPDGLGWESVVWKTF